MATLFDAVTVSKELGFYSTILPFLLVAAFTYGLLSRFKPLGESKSINSIVSIVIGLIFISTIKTSVFLQNLLPFISAMILVLFFVIMIFMFMGVKGETIGEAMQQPEGYWIVLIMILIFSFIAITNTFPEFQYAVYPELAPANFTQTPQEKAMSQSFGILFHPVVLGTMILFFVLGIGAYIMMREPMKK